MDRYAIFLLFLTGKAGPEDRIRAPGLGAVDYIRKPFKMEELHIKIESTFSNLKKAQSGR